MRRVRRIARAAAVGLGIGWAIARVAWAADARLLVVAEDPSSALARAVTSELAAGGYAVEVLGADDAVDMSVQARAHHARAILRVSPTGGSVDLWAADKDGDDVRFRERIASASDGE